MTIQKQDQNKSKITRKDLNYFFKKIECWKCSHFFHRLIITKYHGILCKRCYQTLHENANKSFYYFVSALGIEFDAPLGDETKTLDITLETMHSFWKSYVIQTNFNIHNFEKCYFEEVKEVKEAYELIEIFNI